MMRKKIRGAPIVLLGILLVLSTSPVCRRAEDSGVWIGLGETIITPPAGTPMAGYVRKNVSIGTHDDLHARSLFIQGRNEEAAVLMSLAIINLNDELAGRIRGIIVEKTGIPEDRIIISCTHTHSGPEYEKADPRYLDFLVERSAESAVDAWRNRFRGRIGVGSTEVFELGRNDRTLEYGGLHPDPEVGLVKIEDAAGNLRGIAFNYGCHPSVLSLHNLEFTEDWPYYSIAAIKERLGQEVWAAYYQSAQGDIKVGYSAELSAVGADMPIRNFWYAERKGEQMAAVVLEGLSRIETSARPEVRAAAEFYDYPRRTSYPVSVREAEIADKRARAALEQAERRSDKLGQRALDRYRVDVFLAGLALDCARWVESHPAPGPVRLRHQAVRIGDSVFVTFPCEVFSSIGLEVKKRSPLAKTYIIGITGGCRDYVPAREEYKEGGYAVVRTRFSPECADICLQASLTLIDRVRD
jgi:neutral ceramidase